MEKTMIGEHAGIVWRALSEKGGLSFEQLQAATNLDSADVLTAIGWLARENKISFTKSNGITSVQIYQEKYY